MLSPKRISNIEEDYGEGDIMTEQKRMIIARALAEHFTEDRRTPKACACVGLKCSDIGCVSWWEMFLRNVSAKEFRNIMNLYQYAGDIFER